MSSTAPSKRERPTNSLPSGSGMLAWTMPMLTSTVGTKFIVAISGLMLTGFVITHMLGNLQIFAGPDAINDYAEKMQKLGPLLWVARGILLAIFLVHIGLAIRLKLHSNAARPIGYSHPGNVQSTFASRTMLYTGLLILVFVVFHIAHYTLCVVQPVPAGVQNTKGGVPKNMHELQDDKDRHDVYRMMIIGFTNPIISIFYIVCQIALMVHLSHGVASTFQSLGLNTPRMQKMFVYLGYGVMLIVGGGNIAIVVAVWLGLLK